MDGNDCLNLLGVSVKDAAAYASSAAGGPRLSRHRCDDRCRFCLIKDRVFLSITISLLTAVQQRRQQLNAAKAPSLRRDSIGLISAAVITPISLVMSARLQLRFGVC